MRVSLARYLSLYRANVTATLPGSMNRLATTVLRCDPTSISFSSTSNQPDITSPETLDALQAAAHRLSNLREIVAFPTETVYGLGANALDADSVSQIFRTKGRPADNPLIVHVSSLSMLRTLLPDEYRIPPSYEILIKHFWPGPLTLLFPRREGVIPQIVTASQPTVAIRMPSHPVARALIAFAGVPLAAPSANTSGKPSPTRAEHVLKDLEGKVGLILDGGQCGVGLESTVVDGLREDGDIRILRPGGVTFEDMTRVLQMDKTNNTIPRVLVHRRDYADEAMEQAPTTPGMKYRHYSPIAPVTLLLTRPKSSSSPPLPVEAYLQSLQESHQISSGKPVRVGVLAPEDSDLWGCLLQEDRFEWHRYPLGQKDTPSTTAYRLFDGLITLDERGVDHIIIEEVDEEREGLAVMNRVRKAASDVRWVSFGSEAGTPST
jgi:L-threonylcarbamoyladenylate synthase